MPYSITTKDGITVQNIPDNIDPNSDVLKERVMFIREQNRMNGPDRPQLKPPPEPTPPPPEPTFRDRAIGTLETGAALASGALAEPIAGLAGTFQALNPFAEEGAGAQAVQSIREGMTFQPRTEQGQEQMQAFGEAVQTGMEFARTPAAGIAGLVELATTGGDISAASDAVTRVKEQGLGKELGQQIFDATGSPLAATIAEISPDAALNIVAAKATIGASKKLPAAVKEERIINAIREGSTDSKTAKYIIDGSGKLKTDLAAKEAMRQGMEEGVVAAIKGSGNSDKASMRRMLEITKKGRENKRFAVLNRPYDVVGETLGKRIKHLKKVNTDAGRQLDSVAKSLKGQPVDPSSAIGNFQSALQDMGIALKVGKGGKIKASYKGSDIEGIKPAQRAINQIVDRMANTKTPDAYDVHRLKKFIDEHVTFGKSGEGLAGKTERILKSLRRDLDGVLDANFSEYNRVNTLYSDTINALDSFQDAAGKKVNLLGDNADKAIGTVSRRIMSNTQSRANMLDAIEDLNRISAKTGAKFDDDIITQVMFADELDRVLGPAAQTSLAGEAAKAVRTADRGVREAAVETAGNLAERARGINDENAIRAFNELLRR